MKDDESLWGNADPKHVREGGTRERKAVAPVMPTPPYPAETEQKLKVRGYHGAEENSKSL